MHPEPVPSRTAHDDRPGRCGCKAIDRPAHTDHDHHPQRTRFAVSIGTRVPREHVSVRPLPANVVNIYPRNEFFRVRDQIVVVDPRTLEIVDSLEA